MKVEIRSDSWRWFVIVVGLTSMVTWFLASIVLVAPNNQTRTTATQQQGAQQTITSVNAIPGQNQGNADKSTPHWYSFLGSQITVQWVLALLTGLTLLSIRDQAEATTESVQQSKVDSYLTLRARMGFVDVESINFSPTPDLLLIFIFENYGGKGANILRSKLHTTVQPLAPKPIYADHWEDVGMPCEKGARWNFHVRQPEPPISDAQWKDFTREVPYASRLSIYGVIEYDLGFGGKVVKLGFCQQYDPWTSRVIGKPTFMTAGGRAYNYAD